MRRFRHELRYDADPDAVFGMLTDPAFRERVCRSQQARECRVEVTPLGQGATVVVDQVRPVDGVPGFARRFVGDRIQVVQREQWSGSSSADLDVTIPDRPGRLLGTVTLAADGAGTVETVDGDLEVRIPVVGGRLEELVAALLGEALRVEQQTGSAWLRASGRPS